MTLGGRVFGLVLLAVGLLCTNFALWWATKYEDWRPRSLRAPQNFEKPRSVPFWNPLKLASGSRAQENTAIHDRGVLPSHAFQRRYVGPMADDVPGIGSIGAWLVQTAAECATLCDQYKLCVSFEYAFPQPGEPSNCHLDTKSERSGSRYGQFGLYLLRSAFTDTEIIGQAWKPAIAGSPTDIGMDAWIDDELPKIPVVPLDPLSLALSFNHVDQNGLWLEFGVYQGETVNQIAAHRQATGKFTTVFGFDSFVGLPENWHIGAINSKEADARTIASWVFDLKGKMPEVSPNVQLVKGWFNESLPSFLANHPGPVTLLHIDCDLYSSASYVLGATLHRLQPGSVIVFDELVNFPQFRQHEMRALYELIRDSGFSFEWLATPCGIDSVLGYPVGALEGDGYCLAVAIRLIEKKQLA